VTTGHVRCERLWNRPRPENSPPSPPQSAEHGPPKGRGTMPRRIQLRRAKGWVKPVGAIVVTRPHSKFANLQGAAA
jgi:hypothetical protein